jgi:predicted transcriptional regulator
MDKDELFLLFLLKKKKITYSNQKMEKNRSRFNIIIKRLINDDLIMKNSDGNSNKYILTEFGELLAVCLAKRNSTPKEYQNHYIQVRWFFG